MHTRFNARSHRPSRLLLLGLQGRRTWPRSTRRPPPNRSSPGRFAVRSATGRPPRTATFNGTTGAGARFADRLAPHPTTTVGFEAAVDFELPDAFVPAVESEVARCDPAAVVEVTDCSKLPCVAAVRPSRDWLADDCRWDDTRDASVVVLPLDVDCPGGTERMYFTTLIHEPSARAALGLGEDEPPNGLLAGLCRPAGRHLVGDVAMRWLLIALCLPIGGIVGYLAHRPPAATSPTVTDRACVADAEATSDCGVVSLSTLVGAEARLATLDTSSRLALIPKPVRDGYSEAVVDAFRRPAGSRPFRSRSTVASRRVWSRWRSTTRTRSAPRSRPVRSSGRWGSIRRRCSRGPCSARTGRSATWGSWSPGADPDRVAEALVPKEIADSDELGGGDPRRVLRRRPGRSTWC